MLTVLSASPTVVYTYEMPFYVKFSCCLGLKQTDKCCCDFQLEWSSDTVCTD